MARKNINARRKSQKSKSIPPKLRAVRAEIAKALGKKKPPPAQAAGRAKRAPVIDKDDPRSARHLTVCVYIGDAPAGAMPVDLVHWKDAVGKYGISPRAAEPMRVGLVLGNSVPYVSSLSGLVTFFPVLETGRAADDMRTAALLMSKAKGVLN